MFWILQITPYPAQEETAKKIPGEVLNPIGWIEKMFPILWMIVGFKLAPNTSLMFKVFLKFALPFSITIVWPLASLLSFFNIRNFFLLKIPKTTTFELVAAVASFSLIMFALYALVLVIIQFIPII